MSITKKKSKVVIAATYKWDVYAPAFADALEKNGLHVDRFAFEPYLRSPFVRLQLRLGVGPHIALLNRDLRLCVKKSAPDICLIWTGLAVWPSTIDALKQTAWVTSYTNDDPFGRRGRSAFWRQFRKAIPNYHSHHVYRNINIEEYRTHGADHIGVLRSYFVPWMHYPDTENRSAKREESVVFIGHGEPNRIEILQKLAMAGIQVHIYGPAETWRDLDVGMQTISFHPGGLGPEDYRKVISTSAVSIGFLSRENRDDYTRRYFEIPACGGVLLAERTPFSQTLFQEGLEAEFFVSVDEVLQKSKFLLLHPDERQKIAVAGRERCIKAGYDVGSVSRNWLNDILDFRGAS